MTNPADWLEEFEAAWWADLEAKTMAQWRLSSGELFPDAVQLVPALKAVAFLAWIEGRMVHP